MTFDEAFTALIGNEGGISDNPADKGGLTKYGISQRSYPNEDIRNLTLDRAKAIYLRDYWCPAGCQNVPDAIRFDLFDMAVNSGIRPAVKCLQTAAGSTPDGILGPQTLAAIAAMDGARLAARFNGARLQFMASLGTWPTFSRGWANRIASNLLRV
jgi:lysozyme family protein